MQDDNHGHRSAATSDVPQVGSNVWSAGGDFLGTAEEVLGDYFRMRSRDGREYWLPRTAVISADGRTTVDFEEDDLLTRTVPAPDAYEESQYLEAERRTDEQDEQREHVLRELSEQREALRDKGALPDAARTIGEPVEAELHEMEDAPAAGRAPQTAAPEEQPREVPRDAGRGQPHVRGWEQGEAIARGGAPRSTEDRLDRVAIQLQRVIAGNLGRLPASGAVQSALRGDWMGHPLHPALTDAVAAGLTMAVIFDALDAAGNARLRNAADISLAFGLVSAVPTALAGSADWQSAEGRARRLGLFHILANTTATSAGVASMVQRMRHRRAAGRLFALGAFAAVNVGAFIGGKLVYNEGMGVSRTGRS